MALLSSIGKHVELNPVEKNGDTYTIFPLNTAEDVVVNENGDTLDNYLPCVEDSMTAATKKEPVTGLQVGEATIPEKALNAILGVSS
jgi:hypothetical protein